MDNSGLIDLLEQSTPELMRAGNIPGLNIAVARGGEVVWEQGFGFANLAQRRPMTPDTVFRSGSMGKTYTGTAILQLVEQGVIALAGSVSEYVGFPVRNPLGPREVTVEDLLTHRSGLTSNSAHSSFHPPRPLAEHLREDFARGEVEQYRGAVAKWTTPVGAEMQYSNSGMALLGLVIEETNPDQLSFGNYIRRNILEPLGMTSSRYPDGNFDDLELVPQDIHERIGTGYAGWGPLNIESPKVYFSDFPAGLLLSIPRDHIRLLLAYLGGGELDGHRILRPETVASALEPRMPRADPMWVGLAWMRGNIGLDTEWFGHGGAHMWGWQNIFLAYPKLDLSIVVASNRWDLANISSVTPAFHATDLLAGIAADYIASSRRPERVAAASHSWSWKRGYAVGLNFAVSNRFFLGTDDEHTDAMLAHMIENAFGEPHVSLDPDGFRAGVRALDGADVSLAGLDAFLDSDACLLTRSELNAAWADAGGIGEYPFPLAASIRALFASGRTR